jgi:ATP-binding cassette subfamily B protein
MMTGFRGIYLIATICLGIAAFSKTAASLLIQYLVDKVLTPGVFEKIPLVACGFLLLAALEGGFTFLSQNLTARTAEGITRRLRNYLYDHIQRLTFAYHSVMPTGDLIQRSTSDVDAVRRFYSDQAIGIGRIFLLFVINFTAIASINLKLALYSVIAVPIIVGMSIFFFKKISKIYEEYQEQDAVLSTTLQENLTGVRVVKAFTRQTYEIEKFERENLEKYHRGQQLNRLHSFFWPISDTICGLQQLAGYVIAALMVINGDITLGSYLAYVGLVMWIIFPMRNLGRLIVQTSTGLVSYSRLAEILKETREPLTEGDYSPDGKIKGRIEFKNVGFNYEAGYDVLKNIDFACEPGQSIALMGSTGSGKTSLINLLPRFYDCTQGAIYLDGVDITRYPREYLRKQIGIVEQEPFLFSRSILENITYGVGRDVAYDEVVAAAKAAAIHDVILTFPEGYKTKVGEKGVTLSGGQKQRVAIARTLLKNPRILILDDSTSSVDLETEAVIREALLNLMHNRTTFIIAHRIQSIMNADLILVFDKGEIVQRGTHDTLINQPGIYRQIFDIQTRIDVELEKEIASV